MAEVDEELLDGVRLVATRCVEEALRILDRGTPAMKLRLISVVYSRLASQLGQEKPNTNEELQHQMAALMSVVRGEDVA